MSSSNIWGPRILSILRIIAALLFMEHGFMKALHFPVPQPGVEGPLPPMLMAAASIEIVGGTLLALGLFTRPAAFICSGMAAAAYFLAHLPKSFWPGANGGSEVILYCFIFLYIVFAGAGVWSLDGLLRGRTKS